MSQQQDLVPSVPIVKSRTYAAPLSYVGSTRRIVVLVKKSSGTPAAAVAAWTAGVLMTAVAWTLVTVWYVLAFGFFGLFTIPFRTGSKEPAEVAARPAAAAGDDAGDDDSATAGSRSRAP